MQQAKTFTCGCNIKQLKVKKKTMKQNMSFTIYYNVNMKNNAKMHAFSSDQATDK